MKFIVALILTGFGFSSLAEAGCDHITAPRAVSGKSYSARNHREYPQKIVFHEDGTASFGSALDAPPEGVFYYHGACMDRIAVSFEVTIGPNAGLTKNILLLYPQGSFDVLVDKDSGKRFYRE